MPGKESTMETEEKLKSCNPVLSPICVVIYNMHKTLRKSLGVSYYQSGKDSGLRPEVIKQTEETPIKGRAETLITLLEYYRKYYKGPFFKSLIKSYNIQESGIPMF